MWGHFLWESGAVYTDLSTRAPKKKKEEKEKKEEEEGEVEGKEKPEEEEKIALHNGIDASSP